MTVRARIEAFGAVEAGSIAAIEGDRAHHVARVLRVRVGDVITLFDGAGREATGQVVAIRTRGGVRVEVRLDAAPHEGVGADRSGVIWLQGYAKGDRMERVIRQSTELGVAEIWPVFTSRSVPRAAEGSARGERLRAIAESAATQCGRADVPLVREPMDLTDAWALLTDAVRLRLVPWEASARPLARVLREAPGEGGCAVLVGPEGGLSAEEVAVAEAHGFVAVGLGTRILRTETVAPALLAVLSFVRGDLAEK